MNGRDGDNMHLQVLDESTRFDCGSCTACCDQPWRTMIEADKAQALDSHDFSAYPQLAGKKFYHQPNDGRKGFYDLAKGEGTRCLFLDTDGLCIIHKEMGPAAKPHMCRQFPYLPARTWVEDRVSVNFGCPSVQSSRGRKLTEQAGDIAVLVPVTQRAPRPDAPVMFDLRLKLTQRENEALMNRAMALFDDRRAEDIWTPFAELLSLLAGVQTYKTASGSLFTESLELIRLLDAGEPLPESPAVQYVESYANPSAAPMPSRVLLAATLYPDTLPVDAAGGLSFFKRLLLMPKLFSLATLSGTYASRLLGRNVSISKVLRHEVAREMDAKVTGLLMRYFHARCWQRMIAGTRLPIIGGFHQHIHDLNAILFLARAEAAAKNESRLSYDLIRAALTRVEFHLANQPRLYDQVLKGWLRANLCDLGLASKSLRLMAPSGPELVEGPGTTVKDSAALRNHLV